MDNNAEVKVEVLSAVDSSAGSGWNVPEGWVTIKDAAQLLEVSERTIRRKIEKGEVQAKKIDSPFGPMWVISEKALNVTRQIVSVVSVKDEHDIREFGLVVSQVVEKALDSQQQIIEQEMAKAMEAQRAEFEKQRAEMKEMIEQLLEENYRKTDQLIRGAVEKKSPWWRFWS